MVAVPPHILRAIAKSNASLEHREAARASLAHTENFLKNCQKRREEFLEKYDLGQQQIVPPHLLRSIVESDQADDAQRTRAQRSLDHLEHIINKVNLGKSKSSLLTPGEQVAYLTATDDPPYRAVYDIHESANGGELPSELIRDNGKKAIDEATKPSDKAVNQAFDNVGLVLGFYKKFFKWLSIDNQDMDVISTVHFGKRYENAFWDPEKLQMVFGDGGEFLNNFTGCIDVIGHELTHAVTEHTSPLDYYGQAGSLNEHVSDVFGIMVKQRIQDEQSDVADWLIGEDCILPGVKGTALRSMKAPGTAYDDPVFGKDPQVDHMKKFKTTFEDNGGVHIYSGIPNKAFYLAAVSFGGYSWEKAGKIWWAALRSGKIPPRTTFKQFATATVDCAQELYGSFAAKKVKKAWQDVGVVDSGANTDSSGGWCSIL
ncbi:extracellular metallo ase [Fusarium beomiforme]|uniref:Extracellular metallo ase n=1 Tax=Fusarium beomiforme TaxID=44412 RepID=A0A9P5DYR9_9HYPO|nr:extracellular metallo ase [Fusarium beomiforme]